MTKQDLVREYVDVTQVTTACASIPGISYGGRGMLERARSRIWNARRAEYNELAEQETIDWAYTDVQ